MTRLSRRRLRRLIESVLREAVSGSEEKPKSGTEEKSGVKKPKKKGAKNWDSYVGDMKNIKNKHKNTIRRLWPNISPKDKTFKAYVNWYKNLYKTGKTGYPEYPKGGKSPRKHYSAKEVAAILQAVDMKRS